MLILLINIDSTIPNLALKKIEKYHIDNGDEVVWNFPLIAPNADKIYVSTIYSWNKKKAAEWEMYGAEIGGSGYDILKTLSPEIEKINPHINIGFATRGCIRNCKFCIVPRKEGKIKAVADIYDIWDKKSKRITLLDNNILGLKKHFAFICEQLKEEKLSIDFNQGLDIRLIDEEVAILLKNIKYSTLRVAFDNLNYEKQFRDGIEILKKSEIKLSKIMVYVLVGFNTTWQEDMERLNIIKEFGLNAFIMIYKGPGEIKEYSNLPPNIETILTKIRSPRGNIQKLARLYNRYVFRNNIQSDLLKAYIDQKSL